MFLLLRVGSVEDCGGGRGSGAINSRRRGSRFEVNAKKCSQREARRFVSTMVVLCGVRTNLWEMNNSMSPLHTLPS
jgi:hypothetical protein